MGTKWYYAENGERAGPATSEEIVRLIQGNGAAPSVIWTEGAAGGLDGAGVAGAGPNGQATEAKAEKPPLARRVRNELIEYLVIASYLAVCFGALLFYKAAILESEGIKATSVGLAIVKALILGKFVLILEQLKIGQKKSARMLVLDIVKKALLFTFLLFLLTVAEDVMVGYVHGEAARDAVKEIGGGTRLQAIATAILMFLVLVPYFAYRDIAAAVGEETLSRLLFGRRQEEGQAKP